MFCRQGFPGVSWAILVGPVSQRFPNVSWVILAIKMGSVVQTNYLCRGQPPLLEGNLQWNVPCTDEAVEDFVLWKFGWLPKGSWSSSFSVKKKNMKIQEN